MRVLSIWVSMEADIERRCVIGTFLLGAQEWGFMWPSVTLFCPPPHPTSWSSQTWALAPVRPSPDTGGSPGASCSWTCPTRYPSFISPPLGSIVFLGTVSPRPTVMPWTWDSVPAARYSLWQGRKRFSPVNSRARLRWGSMLYFQALCFQALCFTGFAEAGLALRPPLL